MREDLKMEQYLPHKRQNSQGVNCIRPIVLCFLTFRIPVL